MQTPKPKTSAWRLWKQQSKNMVYKIRGPTSKMLTSKLERIKKEHEKFHTITGTEK